MSELSTIVNSIQPSFEELNTYNLNFRKEAEFAMQLLEKNEYLLKVAMANKQSLRNAVVNVAAIGLSLNPALKLAYLVPRDGQVCLDISYIGLCKLATDSGSVNIVKAMLVYENDKFEYRGVNEEPNHVFEPFKQRGPIVGAYCMAVAGKHYLVDMMGLEEVYAIRDRSMGWKAYADKKSKSNPWASDEGEMIKKTVIKRASKMWPKSERLDQAINILNEHEGIDFNSSKGAFINVPSDDITLEDKTFKNIRDLLTANKRSEEQLLKYINGKFKTELKAIEEMEEVHIEEAYRAMGGSK
jgi:recombination protein RecT